LVLPLALAGYWLACLDNEQRAEYSAGISKSLQRTIARG